MNVVNDFDSAWKDIIEEFFEDFLLFFAKDLCKHINFKKGYEFLEKELAKLYPNSEASKRHVDKLAKVYLKNGQEKWILVHVEVQSYRDIDFPLRMFEYFYRVHDKFDKKIFAIAIFSDGSKTYKPQKFHYDFYGTTLTYNYNTYKILEQNEDILKQSDNPFAMVVLAALYAIKGRNNDNTRFRFKLNLTRRLLNAKWSKDKINRLFLFIDGMMQLPEDLALKFNSELKELTKKGESGMALTWENSQTYKISLLQAEREAAEKAKKEAKKEELINTVRIQLCKKFKLDFLPHEISQKIDETKISNLEDIRDNIFDIVSLEEVAKYLE